MRTGIDVFTQVLVRNNRTTTDAFITDANLRTWFRDASVWAASFHKWPMTEGRLQTTFATALGPGADEWYPEGYKADSFRLVQIGGKALRKLNFADYQIFREEQTDGDDRVFSDFGKTVFINPNVDLTGTLTMWGQYQPIPDEDAATIFTDYDDEGNEAIYEKMSSYLKRREHLVEEAEVHDQRAAAKLDEIWKRVLEEQYAYQTHEDRGGMFKRFDVLNGRPTDEIKRDQF